MKFRPWMIETASDYIRASRLLWGHELPLPASIHAVLGIEILLKSFLAEIDGPSGGIGEQYRVDLKANGIKGRGHDLLALFDAIPASVRRDVGFDEYRSWFSDYLQDSFVKDIAQRSGDTPCILIDSKV